MQKSHDVSRRNFLFGAGTALAGAAAFGLTGCGSSDVSTKAASGDSEKWDKEADVVVVGFGIAGTTAACEAADAGAEVILIEKAPEDEAGGSSRVNGGFMTINEGYEDPENCYRYWRGIYDKDVIESRLKAWPLMQEWIEANPIDGLEEYANSYDVTPSDNAFKQYVHPSGGWKVYPSLKEAVGRRSVDVLYSTPAVELLKNAETNEVIGVVAEQDGTRIFIKARKGVVLATGSYTGDAEMVKQCNHAGIFITSYDSPHNTGDAIHMTSEIGGQIWGFANESIEYQDWAIKQASEELGVGIRYLKPSGDHAAHVIVNKEGKRFMDEMLNTRHIHEHLAILDWDQAKNEYPNSPFWMVFDDSIMKNARIGAYGVTEEIDPAYGSAMLMTWNGVFKTYGWSDDNNVELSKGWIVQGKTLEELASKMHAVNYFGDDVTVDPAGLSVTIEEYNTACESGNDPFGRSKATLQPLGGGPYYAVELCLGAMYANAGPRVDSSNRVLDREGAPIGRLYAAGQGCVTFFGKSGNPNAITAGVECGRSAAALDSWGE